MLESERDASGANDPRGTNDPRDERAEPPPRDAPSPSPSPAEPVDAVAQAPAEDVTPIEAEPSAPEPEREPPARPKPAPRRGWLDALAEQPEVPIVAPRRRLLAESRRDFLLYTAGSVAALAGAWWLLPDRTKMKLLPGAARDRLDTMAARVGLSPANRERLLDGALTFDDDVAEAFYSKGRRVRTYDRSDVTPNLKNNYHGRTPSPAYLPGWTLHVSGLASGRDESLTIDHLLGHFPHHEQVTRLVCVEGWSAIAGWGGLSFADFLAAFPPAPGARWAALRSSVSLDFNGRPETYYVSIDLGTARHPQTLLATHRDRRPLDLAHGAPLRLVAPMKLGLKNIKAITDIEYTAEEPPDYWARLGYSKYDGL